MDRCPAQGPTLLPQELGAWGAAWTWLFLSPGPSFLPCCGLQGPSDTSQDGRAHCIPALQPELGFFMLLNEIKHFVCRIFFPRG